MRITKKKKKITKKCLHFPKLLCILGFLQMEMECERVNMVLVIKWSFLIQQVSLYYNTKMPGKWVSKDIIHSVYFNYYKGKFAKEYANMFSLKIRTVYNIISRAEREWRLDLKGSTGRPKKATQRVERKIIKTVYDSPQSRTRGLALQLEKDLRLRISLETNRNVLENTNILQEWLVKNPYCHKKI